MLTAVPVGGTRRRAAGLLALALVSLWRVGDPARRSGFEGSSAQHRYAMACLWLLRVETAHGAAWLFLVLAATWAGDSAAFFVGSRFGRRRFSPSLSPNKTWAGATGGLAGSVAGGLLPCRSSRRCPVWSSPPVRVGLTGQPATSSNRSETRQGEGPGTLILGTGILTDRQPAGRHPGRVHIVRTWGP
jgi:CDP-diglyceride synthetase